MARNKTAGAIVPVAIAGGVGFLAWRSGALDSLLMRAEAGPSAIVNGGVPKALALPPVQVSTQAEPTGGSGGGVFAPAPAAVAMKPTATTQPAPTGAVTLADRLRAIGRFDLATAVIGNRPQIVGDELVGRSGSTVQLNPNVAAAVRESGTRFGGASFDGANEFTPDVPVQASTMNHLIQPGDTLSALASRFGTSVGRLVALNNISDPNLIRAGATLRVA